MFNIDEESATIYLYDEIGPAWWGLIDATTVIEALGKLEGKHVTVRLNTPGGSVDEGIGIFNAIKRHAGGATTIVDSLAASMGSYILQAGSRRLVASNAMVMVHDPWTIAMGNSEQLRKSADVLDKYAARMLPDYAERSGKTVEEISGIMSAETWYTGQEAIDSGFADAIDTADAQGKLEPVLGFLRGVAKHMPASVHPSKLRAGDRTQVVRSGMTRQEARAKIAALS